MGGCPVYASVFPSNAAFRDALQAAVSRNTGAHQWVFITSVQHYKATVAQSCTTFSANSLNQVTFSRLWEAEYYFSEQAGH